MDVMVLDVRQPLRATTLPLEEATTKANDVAVARMVSELIFERLIMDLSLTPPCRRTCALAVVNNNELSWVLEPPYSLKAAYDRLKSVPTLISGHTADPGKVRSGVSSSTIPRKGLGKWIDTPSLLELVTQKIKVFSATLAAGGQAKEPYHVTLLSTWINDKVEKSKDTGGRAEDDVTASSSSSSSSPARCVSDSFPGDKSRFHAALESLAQHAAISFVQTMKEGDDYISIAKSTRSFAILISSTLSASAIVARATPLSLREHISPAKPRALIDIDLVFPHTSPSNNTASSSSHEGNRPTTSGSSHNRITATICADYILDPPSMSTVLLCPCHGFPLSDRMHKRGAARYCPMLRKRVPIPLASRGDTTLGQGSSNNSAVPGICIGRELSVLDDSKFESALQHLQYCRDSESNDKQQGPQVNRDDANKCSVCCEMTVMGRVSAASVDSMVIVDNPFPLYPRSTSDGQSEILSALLDQLYTSDQCLVVKSSSFEPRLKGIGRGDQTGHQLTSQHRASTAVYSQGDPLGGPSASSSHMESSPIESVTGECLPERHYLIFSDGRGAVLRRVATYHQLRAYQIPSFPPVLNETVKADATKLLNSLGASLPFNPFEFASDDIKIAKALMFASTQSAPWDGKLDHDVYYHHKERDTGSNFGIDLEGFMDDDDMMQADSGTKGRKGTKQTEAKKRRNKPALGNVIGAPLRNSHVSGSLDPSLGVTISKMASPQQLRAASGGGGRGGGRGRKEGTEGEGVVSEPWVPPERPKKPTVSVKLGPRRNDDDEEEEEEEEGGRDNGKGEKRGNLRDDKEERAGNDWEEEVEDIEEEKQTQRGMMQHGRKDNDDSQAQSMRELGVGWLDDELMGGIGGLRVRGGGRGSGEEGEGWLSMNPTSDLSDVLNEGLGGGRVRETEEERRRKLKEIEESYKKYTPSK